VHGSALGARSTEKGDISSQLTEGKGITAVEAFPLDQFGRLIFDPDAIGGTKLSEAL
jgi:hypothetical protein